MCGKKGDRKKLWGRRRRECLLELSVSLIVLVFLNDFLCRTSSCLIGDMPLCECTSYRCIEGALVLLLISRWRDGDLSHVSQVWNLFLNSVCSMLMINHVLSSVYFWVSLCSSFWFKYWYFDSVSYQKKLAGFSMTAFENL